jgi:Putative polyhydroxyalkanoic acid system protein (PHA_gran_rgn)
MPRPIIVSIPHSLGKAEALRRLKGGMERVIGHIPVMKVDEQAWSGDRMTFRASALGQVASGTIDVGESDVRLELTLPWLLQRFGHMVQEVFSDRTRRLLKKK